MSSKSSKSDDINVTAVQKKNQCPGDLGQFSYLYNISYLANMEKIFLCNFVHYTVDIEVL